MAQKQEQRSKRVLPGHVMISDAAALLMNGRTGKRGVSHQRVRQMIRDGFINAKRDGHFFFIPEREIEAFNNRRPKDVRLKKVNPDAPGLSAAVKRQVAEYRKRRAAALRAGKP